MSNAARKLTSAQVARFKAINAAKKAKTAASNDNTRNPKCAYVNTTMNPAMLAACVEAAGIQA